MDLKEKPDWIDGDFRIEVLLAVRYSNRFRFGIERRAPESDSPLVANAFSQRIYTGIAS